MSAATVTPADLASLLASPAPHALLDVRERGAYERGHIYRATSLPRRLIEFRLPGLVTAPATPIVLCDEDQAVADLAATTVAAMGYRDVRVLAGGLAAWRAAGRPTVQGLNVQSKVFGERMLHEMRTPQIRPADLQARMAAGADMVIVDTRTPEEYSRGCIPGAFSLPGGEAVLRIADLVARPDQTIVVHCGGRTRSYIGAESLRRMKLPNPVVALENGTMGWQLAGLELERGAARWAPPPSERSRALAEPVAARVASEEGIPFVSPDELRALLARREDRTVHVLDVRSAEEYTAEHIAGAVWAPGGQAVQATDEYVAVRAAAVVLACDGMVRSVMTASWLRRMGLPGVAVLRGGLPAWRAAGGAIETGPLPISVWGEDAARAGVRALTPDAVAAALQDTDAPTVLSVDPSDLYARGHLPGARWVCRSRLELRIAALAPDRGHAIVLTCADGVSSTLAAATLGRLGYGRVAVLEGGIRAWERAGLALETGPTGLADEVDDVVLKPYERGRAAMEAYLRWEEELDLEGRSPHALLPDAGGRR
ncbi:MAG: sulfurtransferase [Candidatus Rokubacteria bacterium]|nr:sulfurtransferase [Candidatus Rokubacteria bacterium]